MFKPLFYFTAIIVILVTLSSCSVDQDTVNVYSGRHYQVDENLFREFTRQTGIRVNLVKADTDQLINRLELEGRNTPADVFITADAGRMIQCMEKGLLQPMDMSAISTVVPVNLRDSDNYWTGFTKRARVLVYDKERVNPEELNSYEDLVSHQWKGRILVRSSQNHYNQTLMASIIAEHGEEKALNWAESVVNNMAQSPRGNDRDQVKAIAAGIGDVAIVNTYYMGLLLNSPNQEEQRIAQQMGIYFPNQHDRGTHINISGVAITAHAPNKENAQKLIEFLLNPESQREFAEKNYEYPVNTEVEWTDLLKEWGTFRGDTIPLDKLGKHLSRATIIFHEAGWN
ncbi:MAG: Fe(3+) ABC transporter substrate-binding protein [Bacteroidetes bacterium]|nr:MAG: Fe(3+) ABC transporter substrate-binding protein [Bacteroidota bacterium]